MYEVHPDDKGQWLLYKDREVLAVFMAKADAEFTQVAFTMRDHSLVMWQYRASPDPKVDAMAKKIAEWQKSGAGIGLPSTQWKVEWPEPVPYKDVVFDAGLYRSAHAGPTVMFPDEPDTPHIVGDA